MATTTSIAGTGYSSFEAAFGGNVSTPAAGVYTALPPYGSPPRESSAEYEELPIIFFGVSGVGTKGGNSDFRGRNFIIDMIIAGATKAAIETSRNALLATMAPNARFSVTVPGGTARPGCKLVRGSGEVKDWINLGGNIICTLTLNIRQMSLSN